MSKMTIPAFKDETEFKNFLNNNPIYLYNPEEIEKLSNEISKLKNGSTLNNEYVSQLISFSLDSVDLENKFTVIDEFEKLTPKQKAESRVTFLFSSISNHYELISSWYKDPDFKEIAQNNLILKNLMLVYKHTGKDPREFISEQKQSGLTNNMIAGILNFDPLAFLSREPQKSILNFNYNDLSSNSFQEILQANLVQRAFNVCTKSIQRNNGIDSIPPEAFSNPNFIELIYSGSPNYLTISQTLGKLSIEDIDNIIQLRKNFCENYPEIKKDPRLIKKDLGMDEIVEVLDDNFKTLSENLPNKNSSDNYREFMLLQLAIIHVNTGAFYHNLMYNSPQLVATFAISDFKKYPPKDIDKDFADALINIIKNYPQYYQQFFEIVSFCSTNNNFREAIFENDFIKNKYPDLKEKILTDKINFISEITDEEWLNINPKLANYINKNDTPEAIKALVSLGNLIDSLNSDVINFIRKNPDKYEPLVKNIMEAKSIEDINPETINFFANLQGYGEAQILLSRFDLFEPIVKKMHEENIEIKKINNFVSYVTRVFTKSVPEKFSDKIIYSNPKLKNFFIYLLQINMQELNNYESSSLFKKLSSLPQTKKMLEDAKFIINEHNKQTSLESKNSKRFSIRKIKTYPEEVSENTNNEHNKQTSLESKNSKRFSIRKIKIYPEEVSENTNNEHNKQTSLELKNSKRFSKRKIKIYPEEVSENTNLENINFNEENGLENFLNENPRYFWDTDNYLELSEHLNSINESKELSQKLNSIRSKFFSVPDSTLNIQPQENSIQPFNSIPNNINSHSTNNSLSLYSRIQSLNDFMQKNLNNPEFQKTTRTSTAMKNLWLICEKENITFEEFMKNQKEKFKQNGHPELTDDEIFTILNFDSVNYFSNEPLKNFINPINITKIIDDENKEKISKNEITENEANKIKKAIQNENNVTHIDFSDLDDYLKERAQTIMTLNAFNVYSTPQNNFVPQNMFYNNQNLTPHIFMTNTQPFEYYETRNNAGNLKIFDYMNLIQKDILNNYENIVKENMLIGEVAKPEIWDAITKYLEYDDNDITKFKEKLKKMGFDDEDISKITENDAQQLFRQTAQLFANIRTANENIKSLPELYATFMLSNPEKYLLTNRGEMVQKRLANELTDIVLKNPDVIDKLVKLLSYYSKSDLFVKLILENKDIIEKIPNLEKKIIQNKKEIIPQNLKNDIPSDNMLIYLDKKNFTKEKFNMFKSLVESFNSLTTFQIKALLSNSEMTKEEFKKIGLIYDNIAKYIKNINEAKTFDEFNSEVKTLLSTNYKFFVGLFDSRFDLCKPMLDYLISSQNIDSATMLLGTFVENLTNLNQKQITELYNKNKENFNCFLTKLNELAPTKLSNLQKFEQVRIWSYSNKINKIVSSDKDIEEKESELKQFIDEIFDKEVESTQSREKANILLRKTSNNLRNLSNENNADSINLAISYIDEKKSLIEQTLDNIIVIYKTSTSHDDKVKQLTDLIEPHLEFLDSNDLKELIKKLDIEASKTPNEKYKGAKKIINDKINKLSKQEKEKNNVIPKKANIFNRLPSIKKAKVANNSIQNK